MMKMMGKAVCCLLLCAALLTGAARGETAVRGVNHRGYSAAAPANTLPAFALSWEMGFRYVETDVSFTKDNVAVLLHDAAINRTARGADGGDLRGERSILINEITYEEALAYDFGVWMGEEYRGTKLPTFAEFLDLCAELGLRPYIELKDGGNYTREQIDGLVAAVREKGLQRQATWISFSYEYLKWVRDRDESARLGYLCMLWSSADDFRADIQKALDLRNGSNDVFLDTSFRFIRFVEGGSPELYISLCREAGVPLETWTVDSEEEMRALDPYITGVTSNTLRYEDYYQDAQR